MMLHEKCQDTTSFNLGGLESDDFISKIDELTYFIKIIFKK